MAIRIKSGFAVLFFFLCSTLLPAETTGYFLDTNREPPRFVQRLVWTADEYAFRYEVVIEKEDEGQYHSLLRDFSGTPYIEVSLSPGNYRCQVTPYGYFNLPGDASDWMDFNVLPALLPEIFTSSIEPVFSDIDNAYVIDISGSNFSQDADAFIRGTRGEYIVPDVINIDQSGSNIQLVFGKGQVIPDNFDLVIRNPGGLEVVVSSITSDENTVRQTVWLDKPAAKTEIYLSADWKPVIPFYGNENRFMGQSFSPAGAALRLGMVSVRDSFLSPGVEFAPSWHAFSGAATANFFEFDLNFWAHKRFPGEKTALTFRLGAGYTLMLLKKQTNQEETEEQDIPRAQSSINANMGLSFLWFAGKHIFMETGLDYAHWFTDTPSGALQPFFGLGWRF